MTGFESKQEIVELVTTGDKSMKSFYQEGAYRITKEAMLALRTIAAEHIEEVMEGANLACMHRDRYILAPKDINLYRCLHGDDERIGEPVGSLKARKADWDK